MSEKKYDVPKLRFPGFTGAWEQRKLGEISDRVTRKNTNLDSTLPLTISAQYGLVDQITYFNKRVASKDVSNYYLVKKGEFAYNKSYSEGFPFGVVKRLERYEMGVLSSLYIVFKPNINKISSDYLVYYYDTNNWHKQIAERAAEGARNHGLLNISAGDFFDTELQFPKELAEQQQLGTFFHNLDRLINLHQCKLEHMKKRKKGFLQKMFPKNGEQYPEIRFPGFTDAWEQHKLGELGSVITGSTPSTQNAEYYSIDGIPWVTPTDISESITLDTKKKLSVAGQQVARIVPENTILITCIASIGKNTILGIKGSFNQQINGLVPNKELYPYFLFVESSLWSAKMKRSAAAANMQIVNKTEFSNLVTLIPKLTEQKRIGDFFRTLDTLINLHQRKLEHLQMKKKALLQQMFV